MESEFVKVREAVATLIENKEAEADILKERAVTSSPEPQSPQNYDNEDLQAFQNDETDEEIWTGRKTKEKKNQDLVASAALVEAVKECWEDVSDKKISRRIVFGKVAKLVRSKGIRITRKKEKAWDKVYSKWRKLKETYMAFIDGAKKTGKGAEKLPCLYNELNELLGNKERYLLNIRDLCFYIPDVS